MIYYTVYTGEGLLWKNKGRHTLAEKELHSYFGDEEEMPAYILISNNIKNIVIEGQEVTCFLQKTMDLEETFASWDSGVAMEMFW